MTSGRGSARRCPRPPSATCGSSRWVPPPPRRAPTSRRSRPTARHSPPFHPSPRSAAKGQPDDPILQYPVLGLELSTSRPLASSATHAFGPRIIGTVAYGRHAIASAAVPAVNQIRASDDYATRFNWREAKSANLYVGTSSMLAAALGLAPSKDVSQLVETALSTLTSPHLPSWTVWRLGPPLRTPEAQPELGGSSWPQERASGRSKVEAGLF